MLPREGVVEYALSPEMRVNAVRLGPGIRVRGDVPDGVSPLPLSSPPGRAAWGGDVAGVIVSALRMKAGGAGRSVVGP